LRRLGVPERDVEDVAHDMFVIVHQRLADFDATRPVRPWLFGIAFRVASDRRRKASVQRESLDVQLLEPSVPAEAERGLVENERRAFVRRALECVELDRRAVLVLHEIDGVPIPRVAESLGIPLNTAYSRLRLAREEFRAAVKRLSLREDAQ